MIVLLRALLIVCLLAVHDSAAETKSAFTIYKGGRLGDKIKATCGAKWLSLKYGIPFLYGDYPLFNNLNLSRLEKKYNPKQHIFKSTVTVIDEQAHTFKKNESVLYIIKNGTSLIETRNVYGFADPEFKALCKKLFTPKKPLKKINLPKDKISVAVHVRKGGGFDQPLLSRVKAPTAYADVKWPLKFPPNQYYIDQLKTVFELYEGKPLHVHIFTDDPNPSKIVNIFKNALNDLHISFSCRTGKNTHDTHVLEDLFAMADFECLIRPSSGLSQAAQFFGNHTVVIAPASHKWEGKTLIIDKVDIKDLRVKV